jgi:hypothetical protein
MEEDALRATHFARAARERLMALMMSPRSPSSRKVGSSRSERCQTPGSISLANPKRFSTCNRPTRGLEFCPQFLVRVRSELKGHPFLGSQPKPIRDVVLGNDQILIQVVPAPGSRHGYADGRC